MYEKKFITDAITRSAETAVDRRKMLTIFGLGGAGAAAATVLGGGAANAAEADGTGPSDASVLNFALNLEYLEAEFYLRAATGEGLAAKYRTGVGPHHGGAHGGHKVPFKSKVIRQYAEEIAGDEKGHVLYLRKNLASAAIAQPRISLHDAFTSAARAAGVVGAHQTFDPFANETNFLLGAFLFEDVGVTAYKGAAKFLADAPNFLEAAAGILAVEAYHAGIVRSALYAKAEADPALFGVINKLSAARDLLDGPGNDDQGIGDKKHANLVPTNSDHLAFSRTPGQVLNIVFLNTSSKAVKKGGFFPDGVNGELNTSIGTVS